MVSKAIDFHYNLLEYYKNLSISEEEVAVLLMIEHLLMSGNSFITADILSLKMSLDVKRIDSILSDLFTRGFIEYVTRGKKTKTSLEPLKNKLCKEFAISLTSEEEKNADKQIREDIKDIIDIFQASLNKTLLPAEKEKISDWVVKGGYNKAQILNALKDALNKNKKSLRSIEKILINSSNRDDLENEGQATKTNDWNKDLEETIRIAKTPWLDKE